MYVVMIVLYLYLPIAVISVALAALKWRSPRSRARAMSAHLVASFALIVFLDGHTAMWAMALFPGMCLSVFRLTIALIELNERRRVDSSLRDRPLP